MRIPSNSVIFSRFQVWLVKNLDWGKKEMSHFRGLVPWNQTSVVWWPAGQKVIRYSDL